MTMWFSSLSLFITLSLDYIDGFPHIEPFLHPWDEVYLTMVNDHFDVFLDSIGKNFIEYFCIDIHKGY